MKAVSIVLLSAVFLFSTCCLAQEQGGEMTIQNGSKVAFHYTLTVDGVAVDSSDGKDPLNYTHGEGKIIPGLSRQLEGLKAGDEKDVIVPPEEAYGMRDPNAMREIARSQLPPGVDPFVGMPLQVQAPDGTVSIVSVAELKADTAVIDFNHPLAGKTLHFQIKIVSIH